MNFSNFEKSNTGFHITSKEILVGRGWIELGQIIRINDITVKFWRKQYDFDTYRIDMELKLFGGESKTVVLYFEPKTLEDIQSYFNTIFRKIL